MNKGKQMTPERKRIEKIRARCRGSLFWTAWYLCEFEKLSIVLHAGLWIWFKKGIEAGEKRFLCVVPRGHFKTSFFHIALVVYTLINDPNKRILIVMHNLDKAKEKGRKTRSVLSGRPMQTYFPELIPPANQRARVWTTTEFSVTRTADNPEASVTLAGMASGLEAGHYDIIIVDDGVGRKATESAKMMETAVEFLKSISPLFEDESSILFVIGTMWPGGPGGFYEILLENKKFYRIILGCYCDERWDAFLALVGIQPPIDNEKYIEDNVLPANRELLWQPGQPIFPERRTMLGIADDLDFMKHFIFSHQMLNVLLDEGSRKFRREDFINYTLQFGREKNPLAVYIDSVAYPWSRGVVTVAMDPTGGMNKDSDWCGITACWWLPPMKMACLLDWYHVQGPDPMEQINQFMAMGKKWNADFLIPESGSMQVWVKAWLDQEMRRRNQWFRVRPFNPVGARKGKKILDAFHPYVASGQFHVLQPEHDPVVEHLINLNISPDGTVLGDSPALADTFPMHIMMWHATDEDKSLDRDRVWDEVEDRDVVNLQQRAPRYGLAPSSKLRAFR